jgi:hypothetical protein
VTPQKVNNFTTNYNDSEADEFKQNTTKQLNEIRKTMQDMK